ncbi:MAG: helix-turn-helix domain-containing protein [Bacteroidales bacterium]|nr:helix-turn-helix domain-containing protein [Bacteroidales bacterium]
MNTLNIINIRRRIRVFLVIFVLSGIMATEALAVVRSNLELPASATELKDRGNAYFNTGNYPEALTSYTQALDLAEKQGDKETAIGCLGAIANTLAVTGDNARAEQYYLEGYQRAEKLANHTLQFKLAASLVHNYSSTGDLENARLFLDEMSKLQIDNMVEKQFILYTARGYYCSAEGDMKMARYYNQAAFDLASERGLPMVQIFGTLLHIGNINTAIGEYDLALANYALAQQMARDSLANEQMATVYKELAALYAITGPTDSLAKYTHLSQQYADSLFNERQFYFANNGLYNYELSSNKSKIDRLMWRNNLLLLATCVAGMLLLLVSGLLLVILRKNKDLRMAQKALLNKNLMLDDAMQQRRSSLLDNEVSEKLLQRIQAVLNDKSVISRSSFSLAELTEMVGSNSNYVSQVINDSYGKGFRQLINEIRINEACSRMADIENYGNKTLKAIYEECGFNSAASFIQAFKAQNGMTPSTYMRLLRERTAAPLPS